MEETKSQSADNLKGKTTPTKSKPAIDPLSIIRPDSPTYRALKKNHKQPENIKIMIEDNLMKEIPETTIGVRKAQVIPIKHEVDKAHFKKQLKHVLGHKLNDSSDSEYEQKNLRLMLAKKREKGGAHQNVLRKVEKRLEKKFENTAMQFGQRAQHMQFRDDEDRLYQVNFSRAL